MQVLALAKDPAPGGSPSGYVVPNPPPQLPGPWNRRHPSDRASHTRLERVLRIMERDRVARS